ncbi:DUF86 domain-containing protein [Longimicrobium sp.]|uniref:HepT-like ribonuclease domain-containing protein n=1 Tax=Longimicrobium sp. TaxID=2029185 RepID=UPI002C26A011|nr:DUF86 domain-containing protein [Longimicrobium sp.]HSU17706.1 DUF86 domain-containing protein [Longimicrobium sp.]
MRPSRTWQQRLQDIIASAEFILGMMRGRGEEALAADRSLRDAVLYNFVVIGEAARSVPKEVETRHSVVPWKDMRDMRNWVAHGYHGVDLEIVARTIREDLPDLIENLTRILTIDSGGEAGLANARE